MIFNTDAAATTTGSENESDEELSEIISQIKADTAHVATAASTEEFATLLEGFGVTPRVALEKGVCEDYNQRIYKESTGVGESYYSYDGIWSSMMRDEDANGKMPPETVNITENALSSINRSIDSRI